MSALRCRSRAGMERWQGGAWGRASPWTKAACPETRKPVGTRREGMDGRVAWQDAQKVFTGLLGPPSGVSTQEWHDWTGISEIPYWLPNGEQNRGRRVEGGAVEAETGARFRGPVFARVSAELVKDTVTRGSRVMFRQGLCTAQWGGTTPRDARGRSWWPRWVRWVQQAIRWVWSLLEVFRWAEYNP